VVITGGDEEDNNTGGEEGGDSQQVYFIEINLFSSLFRRLIFLAESGFAWQEFSLRLRFSNGTGRSDPQLCDLEEYLAKFQETMLATVDESINRVLSSLATRFPLLAQQHAQATHQPSPQQMELEALPSRLRKPVKITGFPVRRPRRNS
jgi:hypothetical protein